MVRFKDMEKAARGIAAFLGVALATLWMFGVGYSASRWLTWTDLAAACVTLAGLGMVTTEELQGAATWPFVGVVLLVCWLFALAVGSTPWLTWLNLAVGSAFVVLTLVFALLSGDLHLGRHHQRHAHRGA